MVRAGPTSFELRWKESRFDSTVTSRMGASGIMQMMPRTAARFGIDTASVDHGPSKDFKTHRAFADAGLPTFENVARLDQLPVRGAVVLALPMKVAHASGAPLRVVAIMPQPVTR